MSDVVQVGFAASGGTREQEGDVRSKLSMSADCVFRGPGDVRRGSAMTRVFRAGLAVQSELGAGAGDGRRELGFEVDVDWDALEDMDWRGGRGRDVAVVCRGFVSRVMGGDPGGDPGGEENVRSSVSGTLLEVKG
jgi:hypothetical protein